MYLFPILAQCQECENPISLHSLSEITSTALGELAHATHIAQVHAEHTLQHSDIQDGHSRQEGQSVHSNGSGPVQSRDS